MPTAVASMPPSAIGVSNTRCSPYFFAALRTAEDAAVESRHPRRRSARPGCAPSITSIAEFSACTMFMPAPLSSANSSRHSRESGNPRVARICRLPWNPRFRRRDDLKCGAAIGLNPEFLALAAQVPRHFLEHARTSSRGCNVALGERTMRPRWARRPSGHTFECCAHRPYHRTTLIRCPQDRRRHSATVARDLTLSAAVSGARASSGRELASLHVAARYGCKGRRGGICALSPIRRPIDDARIDGEEVVAVFKNPCTCRRQRQEFGV